MSPERVRIAPLFAPSSQASAASRSVGVEVVTVDLRPFAISVMRSRRQLLAAACVVKLRRTFVPSLPGRPLGPSFVRACGSYAHALYVGVQLQRASGLRSFGEAPLGQPRACTASTPVGFLVFATAIRRSPPCDPQRR